ncbi:MAG: DNA polymerase I [Burkholderiales bacterium]|nr:DNA polymerase I [Burkholderiales bacterium]
MTGQTNAQRTLLLIDGSSYLYRAFHALPDLRTRSGQPTGAIRGVISMLQRLRKDVPADYFACVFDAKGKTFRDEVYPQYKANRVAMPDDLGAQIEPLHECVRALGWPLLMVEGVEADDVIGTLACEAHRAGIRTIVSTGDKDLAQLVNDHVTLVNTMSNETLDEAGVEQKFGVPANRFLDYLTLVGDAIDNVPGVDKVGPKTAVKWLQQYGTLETVIAHAAEIGGVVGENLRKVLDWLPQARALLTVKCDVPLPVSVEQLTFCAPDQATLNALFDRLEFKALRRELGDAGTAQGDTAAVAASAAAASAAAQPAPAVDTVLSAAGLEALIVRLNAAELVCLDTATTSSDPMRARIVGLAFAAAPGACAYIPLGHRYPGVPDQLAAAAVLAALKPWLEREDKRKLAHDGKFALHVFANHGIRLAGLAEDTLLQSYVLESHRTHDLDNLAERHLEARASAYESLVGKGASRIGFGDVELARASEYAGCRADLALRVHRHLQPRIDADAKLKRIYRDIELPVSAVLFAMERAGVLLDSALLERHGSALGERMAALERQAYALAGHPFNLNSPKQICEILFERLKLPVIKKTPSGSPSTDEDVLQALALDYPLPKLLLDYRAIAKLKSTYTDKLPRMVHPGTGRVHTHYAQAVAVTGRLSSNEPNLQNIPVRTAEGRRIREAFIAPPGWSIVSADYSQVELRIMAHLSQDAGLLQAFARGEDVHRHTASEVFGTPVEAVSSEQRRYAKVINFGLIYGMSAFGLAQQLGIERSAAQSYMERYFARYPGVADYMARTREQARSLGYVETVFGRRLWLPEIRSGNPARRSGAERAAINAPMQGTAADLIKLAMVAVQRWLAAEGLASRPIMQVHDELVLEVPDAELPRLRAELPGLMSGVAQLSVPLLVEVGAGPNWERAH